MKLTINSREFSDAVSFVARFSPKRPTNIILGGLMIRAENNELNLSVYDHETAAATALTAEVAEAGVALVHATTLQQWAAKLPQKPLTLETVDQALTLKCGPVRASLPLMPLEDYPDVDMLTKPVAELPGAIFEDIIQRVAFAAATESTTPVAMGVRTTIGDGKLTMTATDRYRVAHLPISCETVDVLEAVIPAAVLRDSAKSLSGSELVSVGETGNGAVAFTGDRGTIITRTLVGKYPPVERLFPTEPTVRAVIGREATTDATLRAALALEPMGAVKFTFNDGTCTVEGASEGKGMTEELEVAYDDQEIAVNLRPQFFVDGLTACRADDLHLWFTHEPAEPKPKAIMLFGGDGYQYLMQPNLLLK